MALKRQHKTKTAGNYWLLGLAAVLVLSAASALGATATTGLSVRGNSALSDAEVRSFFPHGAAPSRTLGASLAALQEAYFERGFLLASFELSAAEEDSSFVLTVVEGDVARVGRANISGARIKSPESVRQTLGLVRGGRFVPRELRNRIRELLESYDDAGYPFAQVWIDSIALDAEQNRVHVAAFVVEGDEKMLQDIHVEGLKKTRPEMAIRLSGLEPGRPYRASALRDAFVRLSASGVFEDVSEPRLRVSSDGRGVDAVLVVEESKQTHSFLSALGYATEEGGAEKEISGLAHLQLNNIGGSLKDLGVFWSNDGKKRNETRLSYRDRFFLGKQLGVGLTIEQIGVDTLYTWQSVGAEVERPMGRLGANILGVTGGVFGDRNVFSVGTLLRSWRLRAAAGVSLARGSAKRKAYFKAGLRLTLARKTRYLRGAPDGETIAQYVVEFHGEGSVRLRPIVRAGFVLQYKGLESNETVLPISERFYIGGARTLRGYKENQFNGRRVATLRSELRLGRRPKENVYVFTDAGFVAREKSDDGDVVREDVFKAGYGFGLRTRSRVGNVDLSFGVGDKLSLQQTKVHVFLEQNF